MFPLDSASRGRSIGDVLGSMIDDPHAWEKAAHRLTWDHSEIALLVPEFLAAVTTLCDDERKENRRYDARNRETAEDAEWESQNLGDYLKILKGARAQYWLFGIFGGIPLLALTFAIISEIVSTPVQISRSQANQLEFHVATSAAVKSLRERERTDILNRLADNRRLSDEQTTYLERCFGEKGRHDLVQVLRALQFSARDHDHATKPPRTDSTSAAIGSDFDAGAQEPQDGERRSDTDESAR
jgi:hypothetical protein